MQKDTQKATRREFLKISGKVAGAAILSGLPGTHSQAASALPAVSAEKRVQIIRSIMKKAKAVVGPDFPIIIKINSDDIVPQGIQPDTFPFLAQEVVNTGVDALDISGNNPIVKDIEHIEDESYFFDGASRLDVNVPIILTGGNRSVSHMEKLLKTNEIEFLGVARPLIREPDLPKRWLLGTADDRATCISCNECFRAVMYGETAYCILDI